MKKIWNYILVAFVISSAWVLNIFTNHSPIKDEYNPTDIYK